MALLQLATPSAVVLLPLHAPGEMVEWRDQVPVLQSYHEALVQCVVRLAIRDRDREGGGEGRGEWGERERTKQERVQKPTQFTFSVSHADSPPTTNTAHLNAGNVAVGRVHGAHPRP